MIQNSNISISGSNGKENAESFFKENGFETRTEIKHGGPENRKIDVVAFANQDTTLNYRTIDDSGASIMKSDEIKKGAIAGIEAKSSISSGFENEQAINRIECQVRDAARSGKFDRVYAYKI